MRFLFLLTLAAAFALTLPTSRATNLVTYPFDSYSQDPEVQGGVTATSFSATSASDAVVGTSKDQDYYAYILITETSTSVNSAVSHDQFAQFTITPPAKAGMQLSQVQFTAARGGDSTPRNVALRWSFDNYKSNLGVASISSTWPNTKSYTFNLNAFAGGPVTLRFYASAEEISQAAPSIRFTGIVVTGFPIIYPPTVTPKSTNITTSHKAYPLKGTAYSSIGIGRVEVSQTANGVYSGANGTTNWTYKATSLRVGRNVFFVRAIDKAGTIGPSVKITVRGTRPTPPNPSPTPRPTP